MQKKKEKNPTLNMSALGAWKEAFCQTSSTVCASARVCLVLLGIECCAVHQCLLWSPHYEWPPRPLICISSWQGLQQEELSSIFPDDILLLHLHDSTLCVVYYLLKKHEVLTVQDNRQYSRRSTDRIHRRTLLYSRVVLLTKKQKTDDDGVLAALNSSSCKDSFKFIKTW